MRVAAEDAGLGEAKPMIESSSPMTWLDVARTLATPTAKESACANNLTRARAGWFGLQLEGADNLDSEVLGAWLHVHFPGRVQQNPLRIMLEGPPHAAELPVFYEQVSGGSQFRPTFGIIDGAVEFGDAQSKESNPRPVAIAAALSVKGGTGRTTTSVGLALRWAEKAKQPILLVDADLEAPGISYLFRAAAGEPKISLEDLVAVAHAEVAEDAGETVDFVAERMKDHLVSGNIYILPLRRDLDELASSALRPEQLSTPERPFALGDLLGKVADKLGCGGVVVDVRAGLVPIGVNLAMDPDVSPLLVTTLSDQALKATGSFVAFLARESRRSGTNLKKPLLVINRVPSIFRQSGMDRQLIAPLSDAMLAALVPEGEGDLPAAVGIFDDSVGLEPYEQMEVPELPDLQVSAADWTRYVDQLNSSGFLQHIGFKVDGWIDSELSVSAPVEKPKGNAQQSAATTSDRRTQLAEFAESLVSAETAQGVVAKPLVTKPLSALTQRFQSEVPIAISEGAKGTGKTLAARYFIDQGSWEKIVSELIGRSGAINALVLPVCASVQASSSYQKQVDTSREAISQSLGTAKYQSVSETTSWVKARLAESRTELDWVNLWLDVIAWSAGFEPGIAQAGGRFIEFLRSNNQHVLAIFEGLEELYTSTDDPGVQSAMRAALVSLPQRLRSERRRPLGLIVFARRDTVESAITQNLDQYRREYSPFALSWTDDDVLELAAWLATQANALPGLWTPEFGKLNQEEKSVALEVLWGRKLGPDDEPGRRIREAYTATWIIAVLSDLQGRLVPRDLIRLLSNAAKVHVTSDELSQYVGRLLIPKALKAAVEPTSEKKVEETEEEIRELKPIFGKFRAQADKLAVPLDDEAMDTLGLSNQEIDTLKRHGIVFGDNAPYEVPELFRRGLKLRHAGARRSVVNLYRRARQL